MIIDGKFISKKIKQNLKNEIENLKSKNLIPGLAVVLVGEDPASKVYVKNKKTACKEVGIYSEEYILPFETSQDELIGLINKLNSNPKIHGILVQLPLPNHIDEFVINSAIAPEKDVDVFNPVNTGKMFLGKSHLLPCTPAGIVEIIKHENIPIEGKNCAIIGRSNIVGKPLAILLLQRNATVTICHSKTKNLESICKQADILICAAGNPKFITENMVKDGATVIDVGINRLENGKICGDVDFESVKNKAKYITPVPGGVGPMTIAMLLKNTVTAAKLQNKLLK